jgi:SAM-dependent methyltransferase
MPLASDSLERPMSITYKERSEFYEYEYTTAIDQKFLKSLITPDVGSILEVPSGVGRNAVWLAKTGRSIVVVDREFNMIKRLRERMGACESVYSLVADMRSFSFNKQFDLIIVPQGGFQLIIDENDARSALENLYQCLSPTGKLVVDIAVFNPRWPGDKSVRPSYYDPVIEDGQLVHEWERKLPDGRSLKRSRIQHHEHSVLRTVFRYSIADALGNVKSMTSEMKSKIYSYDLFIAIAKQSNLHPIAVYRNYEFEPFTEQNASQSGRMIFLMTRS